MIDEANKEVASSESTALVEINTADLNKESLEIINQIIAAEDADKTKDLTYLFNVNQNKKTMVRLDKLSALQDQLVAQLSKRVVERSDEVTTQEIMNALKIIQDIMDRGTKQITAEPEKPLIQINQQTNNIGGNSTGLSRDSRRKVEDVVSSLLRDIANNSNDSNIVDAEPIFSEDENDD